jgi:3-hydroxybutyryl-CoA dehydrogenase
LAMLVNEAASALMEGVASPQDIDTAMQLGTNYPRGPLVWADFVGLDVILSILNHLEDEYGDERYCAMPLLRQKVDAGKLGRKAGEGFYSYHPEHAR